MAKKIVQYKTKTTVIKLFKQKIFALERSW